MFDIEKAANEAEVIIRGYAVETFNDGIRVLSLNNGYGVAVLRKDGTLIETNMDDIEVSIAREVMFDALKYMEPENAEVLQF